MKAVLFDFNGTLFFDSDINAIAWRQTIAELTGDRIDFDQIYPEYKSVRNEIFVEKVFEMMGHPADPKEILYWARRKETKYYHSYCRQHHRNRLAPGAEELLDFLKEKKIPFNLCTASLKENVDFYFSYIGLNRWFDREIVAYDDGTFQNKVEMYQAAAERIGYEIGECLVFEDSPRSINEAIEAGCRSIVAIQREEIPQRKQILQVIRDFTEFDRKILEAEEDRNVSRETFEGNNDLG